MSRAVKITIREKQVLRLIAEEHSVSEIAQILQVSPHTVISHRNNLKKKFMVRNGAGLVREGFFMGILQVHQNWNTTSLI